MRPIPSANEPDGGVGGSLVDQAVAVEGEEIRQARPLDLAPHVFDRQLGDRSPSADLSVVAFISQ